ncbi:MAG: DUF4434 domain-containing protein [Candidatus Hydrogenedentes bacterium]|nr:DUF4434 domain-containing protein [Candidatus Hydrogenedentota bacterium]
MRLIAMKICMAVVVAVSAWVPLGCAGLPASHGHAKLTGILWWIGPADAARPVDAWQEDLEALDALGMDTIIFISPHAGAKPQEGSDDHLDAFLGEMDRRGMRVYLCTGQPAAWWTLPDPGPEIIRATAHVQDLATRYSGHESFAGFYIPYECYVMWGDAATTTKRLYREVASACKAAAPAKRTLISPFFILDDQGFLGDFRWATPEEYRAFWEGLLLGSDIDTVALQDSGEHLACYTLEQRAPFFQAMKDACDAAGKTLWANVETGELNVTSLEDYVARFGAKTHVNDPKTAPFWRGVPADKLVEKLAFCRRYTDTAVTWGYSEFVRTSNGPKSAELYLDYFQALR